MKLYKVSCFSISNHAVQFFNFFLSNQRLNDVLVQKIEFKYKRGKDDKTLLSKQVDWDDDHHSIVLTKIRLHEYIFDLVWLPTRYLDVLYFFFWKRYFYFSSNKLFVALGIRFSWQIQNLLMGMFLKKQMLVPKVKLCR